MRIRTSTVIAFAVGYYLGARAGREHYVRINQVLRKARDSSAVGTAGGKARAVVDLGIERARDLTSAKMGNGANGAESGPPR